MTQPPHVFTEIVRAAENDQGEVAVGQHGQPAHFAIRAGDDALIGVCGLNDSEIGKSHLAEVGYWLAKPFWGRGIMTFFLKPKNQDRTTPPETADLYFLRPAERPGVLGTLGGYEIQEVIGQGGMGVVLKAFDPALHRLVAVKVMAAAVAGSAVARKRFLREAQAAAAVCHDHIVTVFGVHETDGLPYLVMQYVAGESLQDRLDRCGPLETVEIVRIGMQTAAGLAAAHAQGLIHRDIKPANLLLEGEPKTSAPGVVRVKITDFGLARMIDDMGLTENGVVAGTPEYMSPEQARGESVDHRTDLFSLGSVLYALCTGLPPFRGPTAVAVLRQVSDQTPTAVRELNPDVPAWLEALIVRLMAKNQTDRFGSAAVVAELLEGYLAHLCQPVTVPAPDFSHARSGRRLLPFVKWLWPVFALVSLGLASLWALQAALPPQPQTLQKEFYQDFRDGRRLLPPLVLHGEDAASLIKSEDGGLRITLPGKANPQINQLGVTWPGANITGDFEITATYELLSLEPPTEGNVGINLTINTLQTQTFAEVGRFLRAREGNVYESDFWIGTNRTPGKNFRWRPALARVGKLRLAREGGVLSSFGTDGPKNEFKTISKNPVGTDEFKEVSFLVAHDARSAPIDVRLVDLRIRAPNGLNVPPVDPAKAGSRGWLLAAGLLGAALLVGLGVCLALGRGRRGAAPLSFVCSACGKKLKAKAELAGKKVKCSGCGKVALVPKTEATVSGKGGLSGSSRWRLALGLALVGLASLGLVLLLFAVCVAWPVRPATASFLNVPLGNQTVEGVEDSGFYNDEHTDADGHFRWTDGKAQLVIPLDKKDRPRALRLQLLRAKTTWLRILVNDRELVNEQPSNRDIYLWDRTLDLNGVELGEKLVLDIVSNTVVPSEANPGRSTDDRTLGVRVREIRLLRDKPVELPPPETPSPFHVALGLQPIPGVKESGYYDPERNGDGPFRWTNGKARLEIPLDNQEFPRAILVRLLREPNRFLRITINDHEFVNEKAPGAPAPWDWERTLDLSGLERGEKLVLEIASNTTTPKKDSRPLGVQVRGIRLFRKMGGGAPAPAPDR